MYVFHSVHGLQHYLRSLAHTSIGFTPTMGALHEGHLSLLHMSKAQTGVSVVSIFVNPTQFNDPADLDKYPRTLNRDLDMLYAHGCHVAFVPAVDEMYPTGMHTGADIDLHGLDVPMEGRFRPGHFRGMAQVVRRLLDIVLPQKLFMGQKDFQQFAIVRQMIISLHLPVEIVMCPTMREADGLAMSSRNMRLLPHIRERAAVIYETLRYCSEQIDDLPVHVLQEEAMRRLDIPDFRPEYFEIVNGETLLPADEHTTYIVACCAVWAGDVRLIDNMELRREKGK